MPKPKKAASKPPRATSAARPRFATEAEERAFWQERDTADYVDWSAAQRARWFKRGFDSGQLTACDTFSGPV